jgi:nicotinate-nucleotide adenylyltransferase
VGVGVLGGAFDPPHLGHRALALAAVDRFALDRLLVRVVEDPGHKLVEADADDRLALARLAFASVSEAEVELDRFPRTVDSLEELDLADPVFVIGADEFAALLDWKQPERVLELARLGVATRPGYDRGSLERVLARLDRTDRVELFTIEPFPISSSSIRQRVAVGESLDGLVDPLVAAEIRRRGLYRGGPDTLREPDGHTERTQAD